MSTSPTDRAHVRGSVEAWQVLERARVLLMSTWKNRYIDHDVMVSLCEDIEQEQDRLISPPSESQP